MTDGRNFRIVRDEDSLRHGQVGAGEVFVAEIAVNQTLEVSITDEDLGEVLPALQQCALQYRDHLGQDFPFVRMDSFDISVDCIAIYEQDVFPLDGDIDNRKGDLRGEGRQYRSLRYEIPEIFMIFHCPN